jgi:hypothetical protein
MYFECRAKRSGEEKIYSKADRFFTFLSRIEMLLSMRTAQVRCELAFARSLVSTKALVFEQNHFSRTMYLCYIFFLANEYKNRNANISFSPNFFKQ